MIVPKETIDETYYLLNREDTTILILINLHVNGLINDEKLNALFKQYRNKTLIKQVNTYHCKINNQWYSCTNTFEVYQDCYQLCNKIDFDLELCLKYFNLLLNKNRNYCIDHLYFTYIKPIIDTIDYNYDLLNKLDVFDNKVMSYEKFADTWEATSGYCCSDCDGCLGEYKRSRYRNYIGYDIKSKTENEVKRILNSMKTKSALKNINNPLL